MDNQNIDIKINENETNPGENKQTPVELSDFFGDDPQPSNHPFIDLLTTQCIVTAALAIAITVLAIVSPQTYEQVRQKLETAATVDVPTFFSATAEKVQAVFSQTVSDTSSDASDNASSENSSSAQSTSSLSVSSGSKSNALSEAAAGGEPNPVLDLKQAPKNVTFLPVSTNIDFQKPVASSEITSFFGYRNHPISGQTEFHKAIDIKADFGTPVTASADAVVYKTGYSDSLGNYVILKHEDNFLTKYGHMSAVLCEQGTNVKTGDKIGKVGSTGASTGNHLHFEILHNGVSVNPLFMVNYA